MSCTPKCNKLVVFLEDLHCVNIPKMPSNDYKIKRLAESIRYGNSNSIGVPCCQAFDKELKVFLQIQYRLHKLFVY
jgi:hypothetical protein